MAGAGRAQARGLALRAITPGDLPFLGELYASTRQQELAAVPWPQHAKDEFLSSQFNAQHQHYQQHFPAARFEIVERGGAAIGRLYVDRRDDEIRIIDIALLPEARGQGLGGALLADLLEEAGDAGLPVRIHVEKNNPALGLYRRLGFVDLEDKGVYLLMQCPPGGTAAG